MSWDATLYAGPVAGDEELGYWNYTHNTSPMIRSVLPDLAPDESWYQRLDRAPGADGSALLGQVISGLEAEPEKFRAMDPANGWGSYDGLVVVLRKMRDAGEQHPAGFWRARG